MEIKKLVEDAHENARQHGWHDNRRSFGELIALCHSELSEALEDHRDGREPDEIYYECKKCPGGPCDTLDDTSNHQMGVTYCLDADKKPCGIPSELADVIIRIADMCGMYGIDLEAAIAEKMEYNKTRPFKHGGKVI